jgi:hypothetical protein
VLQPAPSDIIKICTRPNRRAKGSPLPGLVFIYPIGHHPITLDSSSQLPGEGNLILSGFEDFGFPLAIHAPLDAKLTRTVRAIDQTDTARKPQCWLPLVAHFWLSLVVYFMSEQQMLMYLG